MGAVILDGAVIGRQSLIGARALVTQGAKIPPGSLVLGAPAKVVRKLSKEERAGLKWWAQKYVDNGAYCLKHKINVGGCLVPKPEKIDRKAFRSRQEAVLVLMGFRIEILRLAMIDADGLFQDACRQPMGLNLWMTP
jgi:hypothetical protein